MSSDYQLIELDPNQVVISSCNLRRNQIDDSQVNQMMMALRSGQDLGPIQVRSEQGKWAVIDGQHRLTAYQRLSRQIGRSLNIKAIVRKVSEEEARKISFGSNEGRGWSELDLMRIFYEAYDDGMKVSKIAQEFQRAESKIIEYIKFWLFLHPNLRPLIASRGDATHINLMSAKLLCKTPPDVQLMIYQAAQDQGVALKSYIELCYHQSDFPRAKDDIKPYFNQHSVHNSGSQINEPLIDLSENSEPSITLNHIPEDLAVEAVQRECLDRLNALKYYAIANHCLPLVMEHYQTIFHETL